MESENKVAASVVDMVAQVNPMLVAAASIFNAIRSIRESAKASNIQLPDGSIPSDKELIEKFISEVGLAKTENAELQAWLRTLLPAE